MWSQIPIQFPGGSPSSSAISLAHGTEPFLIHLPQSLPSAGITSTVRSRWQFSHYSECSITQENVEAILFILFHSGRKIWQSINVSCPPTLKVLYECHPTSQQSEVSITSTDGKIQNNQQAGFAGEWMACIRKNINKTELIRRPHLPAICMINAYLTRVQSLRSDLEAFNSLRQKDI